MLVSFLLLAQADGRLCVSVRDDYVQARADRASLRVVSFPYASVLLSIRGGSPASSLAPARGLAKPSL
jgi:hypothetical protein